MQCMWRYVHHTSPILLHVQSDGAGADLEPKVEGKDMLASCGQWGGRVLEGVPPLLRVKRRSCGFFGFKSSIPVG